MRWLLGRISPAMGEILPYILIHLVLIVLFAFCQARNYRIGGEKNIVLVQMSYLLATGLAAAGIMAFIPDEVFIYILIIPFALACFWLVFLLINIAGNLLRKTPGSIVTDLLIGLAPLAAAVVSFILISSRMGKIGG